MITAFLSPFILLGFCTAYWGFSPRFDNERKRAYILSVISSFFMTCVSISFVWHYLRYGIQGVFEKGQEGWMRGLAEVSVVFFGTYLFADLFVGYFKYRSQVGLLTGWIHHTVYIGLMIYLYNTRLSPIFLTAAIMEFPTFDLAISNLFPRVRNDLRFLSSFFLIRILFHFILLLDCTRPVSRNITDGSYVPSAMLGLAFVLHVSWFHGGVIGYIKRSKKQSNMTLTDDVPEEVHGILPELEVGTPEDSPLVTPHTPKTYAVLSNLPNLPSMPQIPNINLGSMPTVSIPSFADLSAAIHSRDQLNFGFKEAVKNRWEEQKDKFAGMRRGGGMGLQLNRFGMRRRSSLEEVGSDDDL